MPSSAHSKYTRKSLPYDPALFRHSPEIELLRDSARIFAEREIEPIAAAIDEAGQFPNELWPKMGEQGFLGVTVHPDYGGTGMGYLAQAIVAEELSRASGSVGLSYIAFANLCVGQIARFGTEEQKQKYLPGLCEGRLIGALAMSEEDAGSDVLRMRMKATEEEINERVMATRTRASGDGRRFVLNGKKFWITNGPDADIVVVYARTNFSPDVEPQNAITAFIVDRAESGFKNGQKIYKETMRGSNTGELVLEDCLVPAENILGSLHGGHRVLTKGLDYERTVLAAGPIGLMQACADVVLPYAKKREQFGTAIGNFQMIQDHIACMETALTSSRAYVYAVAEACDRNDMRRKDAAGAYLHASVSAADATSRGKRCAGGMGLTTEMPLARYARDADLYRTGGGTEEIRKIVIAKELLKPVKI